MSEQFEKASRLKLRYETARGLVTTEDLWDLPLISKNGGPCLDDIARALFKKIKDGDTESFVLKNKGTDETLQLRFALVKHVIDVRLAEAEAAEQNKALRDKSQQILEAIARQEGEALMSTPLEELRAMLAKVTEQIKS